MTELLLQQSNIIKEALSGKNISIHAAAGSGKTYTLREIAKALPVTCNILYVAFNKAIAMEAEASFPPNTTCKTIYSLAYRNIVIGTNFRNKLRGFIDPRSVITEFKEIKDLPEEARDTVSQCIVNLINRYCCSNFMSLDTTLEESKSFIPEAYQDMIQIYVHKFWAKLIDPDSNIKISHDVYLKLFQLTKPVLAYDVILLDECQDSNPATLDIILRQKEQKILVGDEFQQLYSWRLAINAFKYIPNSFETHELTTSFRFNSDIAELTNKILKCADKDFSVIGLSTKVDVETEAILVNKNITLFSYLIQAFREGKKVKVLGDLSDLFSALYTANNLKFNKDKTKRHHKVIKTYKNWNEFTKAAENIPEFSKIVSILAHYPYIHQTITDIKSILVDIEEEADFTLATLYKAKGLEWDRVTLDKEILTIKEPGSITISDWLNKDQHLQEIYVAITRARVEVILPDEEANIILNNKVYYPSELGSW